MVPNQKRLIVEMMLTYDVDFQAKYLLKLYERQTLDEKQVEHTIHSNKQGFNSADAPILSAIAEDLRHDRPLSPDQKRELTNRMSKYAKQLAPIIPDEELST